MKMNGTRTATAALAAAAIAAAAGALAAAPAQAARISLEGRTLVYRAEPGETNHLSLTRDMSRPIVVFRDAGVPRISLSDLTCLEEGSPNTVRCGRSKFDAIRIELGDRNDHYSGDEIMPVAVNAGAGDDQMTVGSVIEDRVLQKPVPSQVDLSGGPGHDLLMFSRLATHLSDSVNGPGVTASKDGLANDGRSIDRNNVRPDIEMLRGTGADDTLVGGPGPDVFMSTEGEDTLVGGSGDDLYLMGPVADGATKAVGGGGRDTATYARRTAPLNISPDDPAFRDGEARELDQLEGIEVAEGGSGPDNMVTPLRTDVGYRLIGGPGNDVLSSGDGKDRLIGGPGEDLFASAGREDVIEARDGIRERLDCGSNGDDRAVIDVREAEIRGCEIRFGPLPQFIGVPRLDPGAVDARVGRPARLRIDWTHPVSWRALDSVTLSLHAGGEQVGRAVLDQESRRVRVHGDGVDLVPRSVAVRAGRGSRRVALGLALRFDRRLAGRTLEARLSARDDRGRRQSPRAVGTVSVR